MLSTLRHDASGRILTHAKELGAWTSWASFGDGFCLVRSLAKPLGIQPGELNVKLVQAILKNSAKLQAWAEKAAESYEFGLFDRLGELWDCRDGNEVQSWGKWRREYLSLVARYRTAGGSDDEWVKQARDMGVEFDSNDFFKVSASYISCQYYSHRLIETN